MTHLSPEEIASFAAGDTSRSLEAHVDGCEFCRTALENYSGGDDSFPSLPESLAALVDETEAARQVIQRLRAGVTADDLVGHPTIHSPGGIRALAEESAAVREIEPPRALALTEAAVRLLGALGPRVPALLQAATWREHANALRYNGHYREGLQALDHADAAVRDQFAGEFESARIAFTRATLLWKLREDLPRAVELARQAGEVYHAYGDLVRALYAEQLVGGILFRSGDLAGAAGIFEKCLSTAAKLDDSEALATAHHNLAVCAQDVGQVETAAIHYRTALALYEHLSMDVAAVRVQWSLGLLSLRLNQARDGVNRLETAARAFRASGNESDAALVLLDLVEHFASTGGFREAGAALGRIQREALPQPVRIQLSVIERALRMERSPAPAVRQTRELLLEPPDASFN